MVFFSSIVAAILIAIVVKILSGNSLAAQITGPAVMAVFVTLDAILARRASEEG